MGPLRWPPMRTEFTKFAGILTLHFRIGLIPLLTLFEILILVCVAFDGRYFRSLGLSAWTAFRLIHFFDDLLYAILISLAFFLFAPFVTAIIRGVAAKFIKQRFLIAQHSLVTCTIHVALSVVFLVSILLLCSMRRILGCSWSIDPVSSKLIATDAFRPVTLQIVEWPFSLFTLLVVALGLFNQVSPYITREPYLPKNWPFVRKLLADYIASCYLLEMDRLHYPRGGRRSLNFGGSAAPEILVVRRRADSLARTYQSLMPGSKFARKFLIEIMRKIEERVKQTLLPRLQHSEHLAIELFPSTSRALEIALLREVRNVQDCKIILSPFEHESEVKVAGWAADLKSVEVSQIVFDWHEFNLPWTDQIDLLVAKLVELLGQENKLSVLILSEICYFSGLLVPVTELFERISKRIGTGNLRFIIDGAHSMGDTPAVRDVIFWDYYLFSAHKWLLSPEPCGILISKASSVDPKLPQPYDVWSSTPSTSTASYNLILGVESALSFVTEARTKLIISRSAMFFDLFFKHIDPYFVSVGPPDDSQIKFMRSIYPRRPWAWVQPATIDSLQNYFDSCGANVTIFPIDSPVPCVRIAFPYFLDVYHVNTLCRILRGAIERAP